MLEISPFFHPFFLKNIYSFRCQFCVVYKQKVAAVIDELPLNLNDKYLFAMR